MRPEDIFWYVFIFLDGRVNEMVHHTGLLSPYLSGSRGSHRRIVHAFCFDSWQTAHTHTHFFRRCRSLLLKGSRISFQIRFTFNFLYQLRAVFGWFWAVLRFPNPYPAAVTTRFSLSLYFSNNEKNAHTKFSPVVWTQQRRPSIEDRENRRMPRLSSRQRKFHSIWTWNVFIFRIGNSATLSCPFFRSHLHPLVNIFQFCSNKTNAWSHLTEKGSFFGVKLNNLKCTASKSICFMCSGGQFRRPSSPIKKMRLATRWQSFQSDSINGNSSTLNYRLQLHCGTAQWACTSIEIQM